MLCVAIDKQVQSQSENQAVEWPDSDKTQELILAARRGESTAVNQLLDRHREALRRLVDLRMDNMVKRRVDASDIVQDVLVEANRRLPGYLEGPTIPFHLWLRGLARDRMIDAHRRHRVAGRRSVDREVPLAAGGISGQSVLDLAQQLNDPRYTPATAALQHELTEQFQKTLEELAETDREVVFMRHFEQLSNQEIAQALNLTEAAASMRYLRAVKRLKAVWQQSSQPPEHGE